MKKYIIGIIAIFFLSFAQVGAFDGKLISSNTNIGEGDNFSFQVEIELSDNEDLKSLEIDGLENFDIIGKSQQQKIFSSSRMVNGDIQKDMTRKFILTFALKPKSEGKFTLGPATFSDGEHTGKTNTIEINVEKSKVSSILHSNNKENNSVSLNNQVFTGTTDKSSGDIKKSGKGNNYIFLFIIPILMIFYIFFWGAKKKKEDIKDEDDEENNSIDDSATDVQIEIPDGHDPDFLRKAEEYVKYYFITKYHLNGKENIFLEDIVKREDLDGEEKSILENIIYKRNLVKYSDAVVANTDILTLLEQLNSLKK